jgi:uncharacterized membrane protein YdjX (TVP38/TMEM64 family)
MVADVLSASFCYALARGTARRWVAEQLRRWRRARALVQLLAERRGMLTVCLLRVLPVHYTAVSYASGLAGVSWPQFLVGTVLGVVPGAVLYPFMGDAAREPFSVPFVAGAVVWIALAVVGGLWARRLWKARTAGPGAGDRGEREPRVSRRGVKQEDRKTGRG